MLSKRSILALTAALSIGLGTLFAADEAKPDAKPDSVKSPIADAKPGETKTTGSGLKITLVAEAKDPGAQPGDIIWVHYTGKLTTGEQFDSSVGGKPFKITLGKGEVIAGWDEGLVGMKIGEKRKLEIPPALAYKDRAAGKIPPNSTLLFDVEMIGIARPGPQQ